MIGKAKTKRWYFNLPRVATHFIKEELRHKSLYKTVSASIKARRLKFYNYETFSGLLSRQAKKKPDKPFIYFEKTTLSFKAVDDQTNQFANTFDRLNLQTTEGVGIMLNNCPEYLSVYFGAQRRGMYVVPINTSLVGEGLLYLINHSNIRVLFVEEEFLTVINPLVKKFKHVKLLFVKPTNPAKLKGIKKPYQSMDEFYKAPTTPSAKWQARPHDIATILYTSGTTGRPKGVVYKYDNPWIRKAGLINSLIYNDDDVLYTCLPLFHANALFLTLSAALWLGLPVVLSKKFSASKFWFEINEHKATVFNSIGAMIPILLKNPSQKSDNKNSARLTLSAACPANCWREFENRFAIKIWEGYSAIDGGANFIFNLGNAPVGSIGRMSLADYKIVDEAGQDVGTHKPGELIFKTDKNRGAVEYLKDPKATENKIKNNYIYTGDLVYRDSKGYLYFVGRKTESMRRRGENVSAYEIESVILKHPDVLECAAYGVPSELGESDIMCAVVPVQGQKISAKKLKSWLHGRLAKFAVPRYYRVLTTLPKTATHRVIKQGLIADGVTEDTVDLGSKGLL